MGIGIKREMPKDVAASIRASDLGFGIAEKYNEWHKELAKESLKEIESKYGLDVRCKWVAGSGWFDGVSLLHAVVRRADGVLLELVWYAQGNGGYWMRDTGHGQGLLFESDVAVPVVFNVYGLGDNKSYRSETDLVESLSKCGINVSGRSESHGPAHSRLWDKPMFDKLCGPMSDGEGAVRYETYETYEALSR